MIYLEKCTGNAYHFESESKEFKVFSNIYNY